MSTNLDKILDKLDVLIDKMHRNTIWSEDEINQICDKLEYFKIKMKDHLKIILENQRKVKEEKELKLKEAKEKQDKQMQDYADYLIKQAELIKKGLASPESSVADADKSHILGQAKNIIG